MSAVCCRYCRQSFQPSPFRPQQTVCSGSACQKRRQADYHRQRLRADADYRQVCLDSPRKWRAQHPDYWQDYRAKHPEAVEQNRRKQRQRDQGRRLAHLANNNLAFDLKRSAAEVYLIGPAAGDLANNNLASRQVFVVEAVMNRWDAGLASCQQQPYSVKAISSG